MPTAAVRTQVLTCARCGLSWRRTVTRGVPPSTCADCKPLPGTAKRIDTSAPGYRLALAVTGYRLVIEQAKGALRLGRVREALDILDAADPPTRAT